MEKDVALREWCVEKALGFYNLGSTLHPDKADDVIKLAQKIEKYVKEIAPTYR